MHHPLHLALERLSLPEWTFEGDTAQILGYTITGCINSAQKELWVQGPGIEGAPRLMVFFDHKTPTLLHALVRASSRLALEPMQHVRRALKQALIDHPAPTWEIDWTEHSVTGRSLQGSHSSYHTFEDMQALLGPERIVRLLRLQKMCFPRHEGRLPLSTSDIVLEMPQTHHERLQLLGP